MMNKGEKILSEISPEFWKKVSGVNEQPNGVEDDLGDSMDKVIAPCSPSDSREVPSE